MLSLSCTFDGWVFVLDFLYNVLFLKFFFFTWKQTQFVHTLKSSIKQVKHRMRTLGLGEIDDVTKKSGETIRKENTR